MSQVLAAISLGLMLASPLIIRLIITGYTFGALAVITGAILIILLSCVFGVLTGGKRLFEILFFIVTYFNINRFPGTDYFGALHSSTGYIAILIGLTAALAICAVMLRAYTLRHS